MSYENDPLARTEKRTGITPELIGPIADQPPPPTIGGVIFKRQSIGISQEELGAAMEAAANGPKLASGPGSRTYTIDQFGLIQRCIAADLTPHQIAEFSPGSESTLRRALKIHGNKPPGIEQPGEVKAAPARTQLPKQTLTREQLIDAGFPNYLLPEEYAKQCLDVLAVQISRLEEMTRGLPIDVGRKHVGALIVGAIDDARNPLFSAISIMHRQDLDIERRRLAFSLGWENTWQATKSVVETFAETFPPRTREEYQLVFDQHADFNETVTTGQIKDLMKPVKLSKRFSTALHFAPTSRSEDFRDKDIVLAMNLLNPEVLRRDIRLD